MLDGQEASTETWLACLTTEQEGCSSSSTLGRLAFSIFNHFDSIFSCGSLAGVGYIGTEKVTKNSITCFPEDGNTMQRCHDGCGQQAGQPGFDWCDQNVNASDYKSLWCAFHPDELEKMLVLQRELGTKYNEVVIDGASWNADVSDNLWVFVVPTTCTEGTSCYNQFMQMYEAYRQEHGEKTILVFGETNQDGPFTPFAPP